MREDSFDSYAEFETEIEAFKNFCDESCPPGPNRDETIVSFLAKARSDGAYRFI